MLRCVMDWTITLEHLRADRKNWARVAAETGLAEWHIRRLAAGVTKWPRIDTVAKLVAYYEREHSRSAA